jgi:hypothetical protein
MVVVIKDYSLSQWLEFQGIRNAIVMGWNQRYL